jgi:hypothetical protein
LAQGDRGRMTMVVATLVGDGLSITTTPLADPPEMP